MFYTEIEWYPYTDLNWLFNELKNTKKEDKIRDFLTLSWVSFHDSDNMFIKKFSISLCWVGWIPIIFHNQIAKLWSNLWSLDNIDIDFKNMKSIGGFMSYLNIWNKTNMEMFEILKKYNHQSTEHMFFLNILISWLSTSVENEFNSQRDLIHLSRITEARTTIQNNPPYVVLEKTLLPLFENVMNSIQQEYKKIQIPQNDKNYLEAINLIHPACKGTAIIVSGSVRNLKKLCSMASDEWKEIEFRNILLELEEKILRKFL